MAIWIGIDDPSRALAKIPMTASFQLITTNAIRFSFFSSSNFSSITR
jgi:hypothetical protein